jgi:hypothetical protein
MARKPKSRARTGYGQSKEISNTTKLCLWRPLFIVSLLLGLIAVLFTVVFVQALLRSE